MSLTPEQELARLGKLSASEANIIMSRPDAKNKKMLDALVREKAGERVFGSLGEQNYKSPWMKRGEQVEPDGLRWASFRIDDSFEWQVGIDHPTIPNVRATPDGLKRGKYTVEAKSQKFAVWAETREAWYRGRRGMECIPSVYRRQCKWQPWTAGVDTGYYVAFHPAGEGQGVLVDYRITDEDRDNMAERVIVVEALIRNWVEIFKSNN